MHRVRVQEHSMLQSKSEGCCCCWMLAGNKDDIFWMVEKAWICRSQRFSLNFQDQGDTATHGGGHMMYCVINFFATIGDSNPGWIWRCYWFFVFELKILVRVLFWNWTLGCLFSNNQLILAENPKIPSSTATQRFSWLISVNVEESNKWTWLMTLSHRGCNYLDEHCDFLTSAWSLMSLCLWFQICKYVRNVYVQYVKLLILCWPSYRE